MCVCITVYNCTQHNIEQFDNFPCYPPVNHHSSDDVYWRGGEWLLTKLNMVLAKWQSYSGW